jgi:hypothetical protein
VSPLATLLGTGQVSLGDVISINWNGKEPRLAFSKEESEAVFVPSKWLVTETSESPAARHSNGRGVVIPPSVAVMQ